MPEPSRHDRSAASQTPPLSSHGAASNANVDRPVRAYRKTGLARLADALVLGLARLGIGPFHVLTTRGRKTGKLHSLPVTLVEADGRRWLVAPYGAVAWVLNARAAGRVGLRRGGARGHFAIREVGPEEAGPVLHRYFQVASATRPYFQATLDSPVADFIAEADRHPVFELTPIGDATHPPAA